MPRVEKMVSPRNRKFFFQGLCKDTNGAVYPGMLLAVIKLIYMKPQQIKTLGPKFQCQEYMHMNI